MARQSRPLPYFNPLRKIWVFFLMQLLFSVRPMMYLSKNTNNELLSNGSNGNPISCLFLTLASGFLYKSFAILT